MNTEPGRYDFGLIIPTREEFDYIRDVLPLTPIRDSEKGYWYEFRIPGGRVGVAHVLFDMGLVATTAAALRLLERFHPGVLAVVGIGGALSDDLRLGDVVVGSVIQEYLKAARAAPGGGTQTVFQPAGDGWPLAERLRNFVNNFQYFAEDRYQTWVQFTKVRGIEDELPFATTIGARRKPEYFVLPIVSGDLVVTDPTFAGWLLSHDRKRALIEMEGAGAARAVKEYDEDVALIVLRGVSDFADEGKAALDGVVSGRSTGSWRRYAAQNAAELLLVFLSAPNFPWRGPAPSASEDAADAAGAGPTLPLARCGRSWEYLMRAADVAKVAAVGLELTRALHHGHSSDDDGDHGHHHDPSHDHGTADGHEPHEVHHDTVHYDAVAGPGPDWYHQDGPHPPDSHH